MSERNIGDEIIQSLEEAVKYMRGDKMAAVTHRIEIPDDMDPGSVENDKK